ncbi:MAG TPA: efflux RND transporter permease subunit [Usitatibacter sp.]|nr:efflux RND transporter permease subunit [Usitatibacter sp.]
MNISEPFIRRPVMTVLLSAAAVVAGILAYGGIPIAALPQFDTPIIQVTAVLPGASPETMASSVATPLEKQFSTISSLDVVSSTSTQGQTQITLEFNQNRDIDEAAVDVQAALFRASRNLPPEMTTPPSYRKVNPSEFSIIFVTLTSPSMSLSDLDGYAENLISPTLSTLPGVAQIIVAGQKRFAVRVKARPDALAARNLTLDDIANAIKTANANTPVGTLDGARQTLTILANKQLTHADDFKPLIVATLPNGSVVRLRDVADVEDSVESVKTAAWSNGEPAITLFIQRQPGANTVAAIDSIKAALPSVLSQMPKSVDLQVQLDRSISIRDAIHDVKLTLAITAVLVILVIYLFLRRPSATIIPALSLPISLIGTLALMRALGLSIDNVSLLGITLAVGLVVDDAIVMLENIVRHIEAGMEPFKAAIVGSKEMWFTIVSISISLVAVFIPIFFMPGVIGGLFHEFAIVVSLAILVSAGVSLTLVPMLASRYIRHEREDDPVLRWTAWFERFFQWVLRWYGFFLDWCLGHRLVVLVLAGATLAATVALVIIMPKGFFPTEDIGQVSVNVEAVEDISYPAMFDVLMRVDRVIRADPSVDTVLTRADDTNNAGRLFINLKPRGERPPLLQVLENLRRETRSIPGVNVYFNPVQNLRIGGRVSKSQFQYVMRSVEPSQLYEYSGKLMALMRADPIFRDVTSDAQLKGLQAELTIDREKAEALGVNIQDIRSALYSAFGDRQVSTIYTAVDSYEVILQATDADKQDESAFSKIYVRGRGGALVPLTSFSHVVRTVGPVAINHTGQLQSITVSFNLAPGASLGQASDKIDVWRDQIHLPPSILTSWGGDAAAFQASQTSQVWLIVSALLVIYVLLGVLYESYIHPLTILAGLPSAAVGALLTLTIFGQDLSIIATIGILMLIGIVKKNAIMMIDFALAAQREQGLPAQEAIRQACLLRFRPILMTTFAAAMGAVPIALGLGTGAELRQPLGLAVVGGLLFSQVITLFITPVIYLYLDRYSGKGPVTRPISLEPEPAHEPSLVPTGED